MFKKLVFLLITSFVLAGCAHIESNVEQRVEPHPDHVDVYQTPPVEHSRRAVYVRPDFPSPPKLKAVIYPLWITRDVQDRMDLGRGMGRIVWETWSEMGIFNSLRYESRDGWPGRSEARQVALENGAQLYVLGQITKYLPGGSQGSTNIGMRLDIYSAREDRLIWSMQQSARIDPRPDMDFILFKRKNWMPDSPIYVIVNSLAKRMGQPVYNWTHPELLRRKKNR